MPRPERTVSEATLSEALELHEAGRLDQARALYCNILAQNPDHADSLHLLGLITSEQGDPAAGAALIRRAMALAPGRAPYHNNLALSYRLLGRGEDAVREYRTAVSLRPNSAEIHNNLATTLRDLGQHEEAVGHYRQAARHAPEIAEIWYNLANALGEHGSPQEVETCFQRALALKPDFGNALANYGRWLMTQARWADAEVPLCRAARLEPTQAPTWNNLAVALQEQGRVEEAEACYRCALSLAPRYAVAHYNLGCLLLEQGRTDEAAECQQAAITADPQCGAARLALCMAQLPILYGTEDEATVRRQRYAATLSSLAGEVQTPAAIRSLAAAIGTAQPFFLPYQGENDRTLQEIYGQLACRVLAATEPPVRLALRPAAGERIRLGIVSGFFCRHTIFKLFLEGWLTHLDRSRFELIGFHTGRTSDVCTEAAAGLCDRFIRKLPSASAWRQAVCDAAPHVLLYPEVGMDPIAGRLAAQRLAPVQCVTWGQPETTGMPTMDYFLTSDLMEPSEAAEYYTERLVRLPNLGLCYLPDAVPDVCLDRVSLGLPPDVPVFWSGQALYKYLPQYDAIYPRIAAAIGDCRFVFIGFAKSQAVTTAFRDRLERAFAATGLDGGQYCVVLPPLSPEQFVAAAGLADVVLDTPGWSGGKSTLDCLAQDPAIVTMPSRFMRGRHTAAILRRIGCTKTIAGSIDEYIAAAVRLAREDARRADVRYAVARNKANAFADLDYIRGLEAFLRDVAERI